MHRRPYPRRKRGAGTAPPYDPTLPTIARHTLPDEERVATAVTRFTGQVIVASTLAITAARLLGGLWPELARTLFSGAGLVLLIVAMFKWLWIGRTSGVPWMAIVTGVIGAIWLLSLIAAAPTVWALMGVILAAWVVAVLVRVARVADGATSNIDSGTSLALACGAFLLFGMVVMPRAVVALFGLAMCVNSVFGLTVALVYVGYTLANPGQPRSVIKAARKRWKSILWGKEVTRPSPVLVCVLGCAGALLAVSLLGEPGEVGSAVPSQVPEKGSDGAADGAQYLRTGWFAAAVSTLLTVAAAAWSWADRRVISRAFTVWIMYDGPPISGVYRPHPWLASARRRQVVLGVVLFLNVLFFRAAFSDIDLALLRSASSVRKAVVDEPDFGTFTVIALVLPYFASFLLPALLPVALFCTSYRVQVRTIHDIVEEVPPPELYPPFKETLRG